MSQLANLTATVTTVLASVIASLVAVELLLSYSNQLILWIGVAIVIYAYILGIQQALQRSYAYWRAEQPDEPLEDYLVGIKILSFLNIAMVIILVNLVIRAGRDAVAVTEMEWDDYIALLFFGAVVIFVFFHRAQSIFLPQKSGVAQF